MAGTLAQRIDRLEKNYLINGGMDFFQRGGVASSVSSTTSLVYSAMDRWKLQHTGTFTGTPSLVRDTTIPNNMCAYSLKHTFQRNASTATLTYEQRCESLMVQELADIGYASFSVWVNAPVAGSLRLTLLTPTVKDNHASQTQQYQSTQTIPSTGAWNLMTFAAIPMAAATNLGLAVRVEYVLASGTDGATQNFWLTQAMLNPGKICSDFARYATFFDQEYVACMRYYEKSKDHDLDLTGNVGQSGNGTSGYRHIFTPTASAQVYRFSERFKVNKRTTPVVTTYSTDGTISKIRDDANATNVNNNINSSWNSGFQWEATMSASGTTIWFEFNWTADAEIA